jgi:hypothetical protein
MSRSNPQDNAPNPAVRWFEWNGETGIVRHYDKDAKQNVEVGCDFRFILLDQLASVGGWHDASGSSIYSNQVKDTRKEPLIVKSFKGGTLAEGIYQEIKDHVTSKAVGGQFVANLYIEFKHGDGLAIGVLRLKGAALGAWMDFVKTNRADLYEKAIHIDGFEEGKKGRITFRVPILKLTDLSSESNIQAIALDKALQSWLKGYFARTTHDQTEHAATEPEPEPPLAGVTIDLTDDDIPF